MSTQTGCSTVRDLVVMNATLGEAFGLGKWPMGYKDEFTDHAALTSVFGLAAVGPCQQVLSRDPAMW